LTVQSSTHLGFSYRICWTTSSHFICICKAVTVCFFILQIMGSSWSLNVIKTLFIACLLLKIYSACATFLGLHLSIFVICVFIFSRMKHPRLSSVLHSVGPARRPMPPLYAYAVSALLPLREESSRGVGHNPLRQVCFLLLFSSCLPQYIQLFAW
jgi:hypothetical protein